MPMSRLVPAAFRFWGGPVILLESRVADGRLKSGCEKPLRNAQHRWEETGMTGKHRSDIKVGARVKVVQKQDQRSGRLTEGIVRDILTKSGLHPHGIKVRLESGIVGRVKEILNG
jgi:uncharacterized repeat protein (TIGR03833 family)